jgi:hypothetical protein
VPSLGGSSREGNPWVELGTAQTRPASPLDPSESSDRRRCDLGAVSLLATWRAFVAARWRSRQRANAWSEVRCRRRLGGVLVLADSERNRRLFITLFESWEAIETGRAARRADGRRDPRGRARPAALPSTTTRSSFNSAPSLTGQVPMRPSPRQAARVQAAPTGRPNLPPRALAHRVAGA